MAEDFTGPTIPTSRQPYPAYLLLADADARAVRAFWRGMVIGAVAMVLVTFGTIMLIMAVLS